MSGSSLVTLSSKYQMNSLYCAYICLMFVMRIWCYINTYSLVDAACAAGV